MDKAERRRLKSRVRESRAKLKRGTERLARANRKMREAQEQWAEVLGELASLDTSERIEIMEAARDESVAVSIFGGRAA